MTQERLPIAVLLTDTHLKESNHSAVLTLFQQSCSIAQKLQIPIFHLGDNFDSRKSQPLNNLIVFEEILNYCKNIGVEIFSIVGNHDKIDQSKNESYLSPFKHFPKFNLIEGFYRYSFEKSHIDVFFLSYFTEEKYRDILTILKPRKNVKSILLTHIDVSGFTMNSSSISEHGFNKDIFSCYDKVLIGHYHDSSTQDNIEYIGSSLQHSFGESKNKGIKILYDDLTVELFRDSSEIQSFTSHYITSLEELVSLNSDEMKGSNRIVFTGSKEELISLTSSSNSNVQTLLSNCKLEFKESQILLNSLDEDTSTSSIQLDKDSIKNHFIKWTEKENIEDIELGLNLLESI